MKAVFKNVNELDKNLVKKFDLSEDLMMEHAANSLNLWVRKHLKKGKKVQIICGCGNNGADGIACARMLIGDYKVSILLPLGVKSNMAILQLNRAKKLSLHVSHKLHKADMYIDCIFGSGLNKNLDENIILLIKKLNKIKAKKLSCDIPSGIMQSGNVTNTAFKAQTTLCMGALKSCLFSDLAKEYVGKIKVSNLGVSKDIYEQNSNTFLLQKKDLHLPLRANTNTNKGSFGHLCVIGGEKIGASLLCAKAGFYFGAGLVSLLGIYQNLPNIIMQNKSLPHNTTAIAYGMGIGEIKKDIVQMLLSTKLPLLLDADILVSPYIKELLHVKQNIVLTPHLKEFNKMCEILGFNSFSIEQIQANKLEIAREFSLKYPQVLVLKGANTIIANKGVCYICTFGNSALSKGGSGDVLSGLIASLLAQKRTLLNSAINGVLAHALSARKFRKNSYALSPEDIIKGIKCL